MKIQRVNHIVHFYFILLLASLACSLPNWINGNSRIVTEVEENLNASGQVILRDVVITRDIVKVAIDMPVGESQFSQFASWIFIFDHVLQHAPGVALVRIDVYLLDEPYFEVTAQADNIKAMVNNEIELMDFVNRLLIEDQRSPVIILKQALVNSGWIISDIQIVDTSVDIEGFPPEAETHDQVLSHWIEAIMVAADYAPECDQINIHLLLIGQPNMTVTVSMGDLQAYQKGEMDAIDFLANMTISE